jgi:hypothetical protein
MDPFNKVIDKQPIEMPGKNIYFENLMIEPRPKVKIFLVNIKDIFLNVHEV